MKKVTLAALVAIAVTGCAHAGMSESYRQQLENSGCTQASEAEGCNLNMSREWNERHGFQTSRPDDGEHGWNRRPNHHEHRRHREEKRHEIEAFLHDSVIGENVNDARQALFGYGCERLGTDHWMKDDFEIRLNSFAGRVRSGRIVN
ncbi:hypothetical protein EU642_21920 [Salmonella enterica]|nr:hypothetical protein [Salmonella enterica]EAO0118512.1 hypothetical protein [Salmonella enterica]EAO3601617.1 hypothetical protein [Salmonella enterica]EAR6391510.1 hypothetical protein [Salmonella enterica]EAV1285274.1 hypothetical protein [Salmonella enterica]